MIEYTQNPSRRSVLKAGVIAGGIGLTGLVGSAAARGPVNGGMAMIASSVFDDYGEGDPFQIVEKLPDTDPWAPTAIDVSCDGEENLVSFWPYKIVNETGGQQRYLFFPEDKHVKLGSNLHVFHNADVDCSPVGDGRNWAKVRVKPDRGRP